MPISWNLDRGKRLVYFTLTHPYTRDQGRAAVKAMTADPEFAHGFGVIVELIGSGGSTFVGDVLHFLKTHRETFRDSRIAVIVTLGSRGAGPLSTPEGLDLPAAVQLFRTYREAERWLAQH